jgi:vesicular inhibitory amino acid transporter
MENPKKYPELLDYTYMIVSTMYMTIGVVGYMMFGSSIEAEITQNLSLVSAYNTILTKLTVGLVAINPITKFPLNLSPINSPIERTLSFTRLIACIVSVMLVLFISIKFPEFHSMMAILGSFFTCIVSIVFPVICYLKFYGHEISSSQKYLNWAIAFLGIFFGTIVPCLGFPPNKCVNK